jgi:hypothetical protein
LLVAASPVRSTVIASQCRSQSTAKLHVVPPLPFFVFLRDLRDFVVRFSRLEIRLL